MCAHCPYTLVVVVGLAGVVGCRGRRRRSRVVFVGMEDAGCRCVGQVVTRQVVPDVVHVVVRPYVGNVDEGCYASVGMVLVC